MNKTIEIWLEREFIAACLSFRSFIDFNSARSNGYCYIKGKEFLDLLRTTDSLCNYIKQQYSDLHINFSDSKLRKKHAKTIIKATSFIEYLDRINYRETMGITKGSWTIERFVNRLIECHDKWLDFKNKEYLKQ